MQARVLAQRLKQASSPVVLDVRSGFEFRAGHIPGALHAPLWKVLLRLAKLPADRATPLVVVCEQGPRAQLVAGQLKGRGYSDVQLLDGHMAQWRRSRLPLER